ncbi:MAG: glycosyltransferase family 39 protein [Thermoguttaceae bacterium]|nr:glycosyltransferase family 39 protein [Thermoguttaceae bacterium]
MFCQSEWVVSIAIFVTILLWFGFWAHIGLDPHHDGVLMKPAYDVMHGKMLFRDTFTQYGALTTLLQAAACLIFGARVLTLRLLTTVFYAGSTVLVWHIGGRILKGFYRIIPILCILIFPPFYFWNMLPWSSVYALFFLLLTVFLFQLGFQKKRESWFWALTGAVSTLPFWCRQPLGLVFAGGILLVLVSHWRFYESWRDTLHRLWLYVAGAMIVFGIFFIWLSMNHAFHDFWVQSIKMAFGFAAGKTTQMAPAVQTGGFLQKCAALTFALKIFRLFFMDRLFWGTVICSLTLGWFIYLVVWGIRKMGLTLDYWLLLPVVFMAGLSLHQYYPVPGLRHYYWGAFPAFLVLARTFQAMLSTQGQDLWKRTYKLCIACAIISSMVFEVQGVYRTNTRELGALPSIRDLPKLVVMEGDVADVVKGLWVLPWEKKAWEDLQKIADSIPEPTRSEQVVNMTSNGIFMFVMPNKTNFDKMYVNWRNCADPFSDTRRALASLEGKRIIISLGNLYKDSNNKELLPDEEIRREMDEAIEKYLFDASKLLYKDKETLEYPEYKTQGFVLYHQMHTSQYSLCILTPTGKTLSRNRNEKIVLDWAKNLENTKESDASVDK